jgi:hypothetical protein
MPNLYQQTDNKDQIAKPEGNTVQGSSGSDTPLAGGAGKASGMWQNVQDYANKNVEQSKDMAQSFSKADTDELAWSRQNLQNTLNNSQSLDINAVSDPLGTQNAVEATMPEFATQDFARIRDRMHRSYTDPKFASSRIRGMMNPQSSFGEQALNAGLLTRGAGREALDELRNGLFQRGNPNTDVLLDYNQDVRYYNQDLEDRRNQQRAGQAAGAAAAAAAAQAARDAAARNVDHTPNPVTPPTVTGPQYHYDPYTGRYVLN